MKTKSIIIWLFVGLFTAGISACSKDDDTSNDNPSNSNPEHEHGANDGIKDNGDGTYAVTLGGTTFTTRSRDFSKDPVITAPKTVSAAKEAEYNLGAPMIGMAVQGDYIIAGHDKTIVVFDMPNNKQSGTFGTSYDISGIDANGAVMTTEGSEDVNFYSLNNGKIEKHFFTVKSVNGSKFLSVCYLDYDKAYVYDEDEVVFFGLDKATESTKPKLVEIPSFANVDYSSDEKNLYFALGHLSKPDPNDPNAPYINYSAIRIYDRATKKYTDKNSADNEFYSGIVVDANYIYISMEDENKVQVLNKHNFNPAGSFQVDKPSFMSKTGEYLYIYSKNANKVIKYKISFN